MEQYKSPESSLDLETSQEKQKPNLILRVLCWLVSMISFIVCFKLGQKHQVSMAYSIGYGISVMVMTFAILLPFLLFSYFRKPNPKRVVYLFVTVLLTFFILMGQATQ